LAALTLGGLGKRESGIRVWNLETGQQTQEINGHLRPVTAVEFLPDGRLLSGSEDQTVRLWDLATGKELRRYHVRGSVRQLAIDRDGRLLLVAPETGGLRLYALP
jgi:WD40 repeat protein